MAFFLLQNKKEDILKNVVGVQTIDFVEFHVISSRKSYKVEGHG